MDEIIWKASLLEKQIHEFEEKLTFLDRQILDLEKFSEQLNYMNKEDSKEILSSLGRGVYLKANAESRDLLVEVGAGIIVKKTPEQVMQVLEDQIKKFKEARIHLSGQLEIYHKNLEETLSEMESLAKREKKD